MMVMNIGKRRGDAPSKKAFKAARKNSHSLLLLSFTWTTSENDTASWEDAASPVKA